jgi:osmotically-inducible protein OsmY
MRFLKLSPLGAAVALAVVLAGCSTSPANVTGSVRRALDEAGLKDVSVVEDQRHRMVTLGGQVSDKEDKARAGYIAGAAAARQLVVNEIAVVPAEIEQSDFDRGIEMQLDAALIVANLHDNVKYRVRNHTVTLTGNVTAEDKRAEAMTVAAAVPNVRQVVNELKIRRRSGNALN